jgi:uncharacterized protein YcaQ
VGVRKVPGVEKLSADEARRVAVWAQGLAVGSRLGARSGPAAVGGVLRALGAVQLDTISVLARSHELVPYARLGAVGRPAVEAAYWAPAGAAAVAFEYWAHAACVLPIESWPWFAARRRRLHRAEHARRRTGAASRAAVLAALAERGPLTATDLGGAKRGGEWWDWSDVKIAAEDLFRWGDVVVTRRVGWRRVYDLPSRAIPTALLGVEPSDEECRTYFLDTAGRALGVATAGDLADYFRDVSVADARRHAEPAGLVPVEVEGWGQPAWAHPRALAALSASASSAGVGAAGAAGAAGVADAASAGGTTDAVGARAVGAGAGAAGGGAAGAGAAGALPAAARSRTTLLSPFDSLVWTRARAERVFGMRHRLEAYTPRPLREHGYFAMPVLSGGRLVARVDPARSGRTFVARHVTFQPDAVRTPAATARALAGVAQAIRMAATWVGAEAVVVERVTPAELAAPLGAAVS